MYEALVKWEYLLGGGGAWGDTGQGQHAMLGQGLSRYAKALATVMMNRKQYLMSNLVLLALEEYQEWHDSYAKTAEGKIESRPQPLVLKARLLHYTPPSSQGAIAPLTIYSNSNHRPLFQLLPIHASCQRPPQRPKCTPQITTFI